MKIKRIRIIRPEIMVEFKRPIIGRLYFLFMLPKMIMIKKATLNFEPAVIKPVKVCFICIPKISFGDDAE